MMKTTIRTALAALAAALIFAGCSKSSEKATVSVSGPEGMTVSLGDQTLGRTPLTFRLNGGTYLFKFFAPGYERKWETVVLQPGEKRAMAIRLERETVSVLIATKPPGAQLVVNGRVLGATPIVLENVISGREYTGRLRMPGYREHEVKWTADGPRPKQVMIDLDANIVKAEFLTKPAKARLFIEEREVGVTPYRGELTEGRYKLRFEYPGFSPLEQTVSLSRGETFRAEYNLTPLSGGISISSVPDGAAVFIDSRKRGVTPCVSSDLPAGIHEVRVEKDGFDPVGRKVEIAPGRKDEIRLILPSSTGMLELDVRPAGVTVMFDGKKLGVTETSEPSSAATKPIRIGRLAPGKHVVTVTHPRARPERRDIEIEIEKGKLLRPKTIDVWIANCEIKYKDGRVDVGSLFEENNDSIYFGPEPGIKYEIKRRDLEYVKRLDAGPEPVPPPAGK